MLVVLPSRGASLLPAFFLRNARHKKKQSSKIVTSAAAAPTPIPALAPVLSSVEAGGGETGNCIAHTTLTIVVVGSLGYDAMLAVRGGGVIMFLSVEAQGVAPPIAV